MARNQSFIEDIDLTDGRQIYLQSNSSRPDLITISIDGDQANYSTQVRIDDAHAIVQKLSELIGELEQFQIDKQVERENAEHDRLAREEAAPAE